MEIMASKCVERKKKLTSGWRPWLTHVYAYVLKGLNCPACFAQLGAKEGIWVGTALVMASTSQPDSQGI